MQEYVKNKNHRTILITGVTGFIGKNFFYRIKNLKPIGIRFNSEMPAPEENILKIDLRDKKQVNELFNRVMPDVIYHFAALTSPKINEENVKLARQSHIEVTNNILHNISNDTHLIYHSITLLSD